MKRIHLKQQPPEIHGMIAEHMASHNHKSMEDTVTCLIKEAMKRLDETDKIDDDAHQILVGARENLKKRGIKNPNLSDAIRELASRKGV
jgi:hypothetical protein